MSKKLLSGTIWKKKKGWLNRIEKHKSRKPIQYVQYLTNMHSWKRRQENCEELIKEIKMHKTFTKKYENLALKDLKDV